MATHKNLTLAFLVQIQVALPKLCQLLRVKTKIEAQASLLQEKKNQLARIVFVPQGFCQQSQQRYTGVAQLVERSVWVREVACSNHVTRTIAETVRVRPLNRRNTNYNGYQRTRDWCSGNISAFQAVVVGSCPTSRSRTLQRLQTGVVRSYWRIEAMSILDSSRKD